jgi:hypothetical protein
LKKFTYFCDTHQQKSDNCFSDGKNTKTSQTITPLAGIYLVNDFGWNQGIVVSCAKTFAKNSACGFKIKMF